MEVGANNPENAVEFAHAIGSSASVPVMVISPSAISKKPIPLFLIEKFCGFVVFSGEFHNY